MAGRHLLAAITIIFMLAACAEQTGDKTPASAPGAPAAASTPTPSGMRDLSGDWRFNMGGRVAITQTGDRVRGTWSQGNDRCSAGTLYLDAQVQGSKLVGSRIDCTRQDRLPLNADITADGNSIAFDIPGVGRVGLTR